MSGASVKLKGVTWDHPRGYDPLIACTQLWRGLVGTEIAWDRRSLQEFESYPLKDLARDYDLLIIDHPHIGEAVATGCLVSLDGQDHDGVLTELAAESVGPSFASYEWRGRQWALPVDAAAQVQAWRPELIEQPAERWSDVVGLARQRLLACPLRPPHSLMTLFTIANNLGTPSDVAGTDLFAPDSGVDAVEMLRELSAALDPADFARDPIAVLEVMAQEDSAIACAPWIYGYASYARDGFRRHRVAFADIPALGTIGAAGSVLGGAGIAISAFSRNASDAMRFAAWITSGAVQAVPYAAAGGQPAHATAWRDPSINALTPDFYRATRATLDGAWVRPRHDGYMSFQHDAAERLNAGLSSGEPAPAIVAALNALHRASRAREVENA